jgi:hypothetical protein
MSSILEVESETMPSLGNPSINTVIARSICDEAIHDAACCPMDCFASLAMTAEGLSLIALGHRSQ